MQNFDSISSITGSMDSPDATIVIEVDAPNTNAAATAINTNAAAAAAAAIDTNAAAAAIDVDAPDGVSSYVNRRGRPKGSTTENMR